MDALLLGAPMATYGIFLAVAIALFGIGWLLGARIRARKVREIEQQAEKHAIKLAEKEDRNRKATFLEIKNKWYDEKAEIEKAFDQKRREFDRQNDELHERETSLVKRAEVVSQREKTLTRREQEGRAKSRPSGEARIGTGRFDRSATGAIRAHFGHECRTCPRDVAQRHSKFAASDIHKYRPGNDRPRPRTGRPRSQKNSGAGHRTLFHGSNRAVVPIGRHIAQ